MLGIPLGWSWLQLTNQSLQSDATQILDEVRRDVEERNAEGRPIDAAMLQQRIDQQTDLNISITVTTAEGETISAGDDPGPGATEARTQGSGSEVITVFIPQSDVRAHTASAWVLISVAGLSALDRKSTRLNSSHVAISYAVFCLKKKNTNKYNLSNRGIL